MSSQSLDILQAYQPMMLTLHIGWAIIVCGLTVQTFLIHCIQVFIMNLSLNVTVLMITYNCLSWICWELAVKSFHSKVCFYTYRDKQLYTILMTSMRVLLQLNSQSKWTVMRHWTTTTMMSQLHPSHGNQMWVLCF